MSDPACNTLKITNEFIDGVPLMTFGVGWPGGGVNLGVVVLEASRLFDLQTLAIPEGSNCWAVDLITGGSSSNFIYSANSPFTAAYNLGEQGWSLIVEPNQ
jgi:hypothetical protein